MLAGGAAQFASRHGASLVLLRGGQSRGEGSSCRMKYHSEVLILGAGAAGLMCAIEAGKRGRSVTVLESSNRAGQKILISGGGRCNFTNRETTAANFISENPHFAKSALARYTPQQFIAMVERHNIAWHEKKLGQLFLRPQRAGHHDHAGRRVRARRRAGETGNRGARGAAGWDASAPSPASTSLRRMRWWWPPAGFRFRRWAPRPSATSWRGSSD